MYRRLILPAMLGVFAGLGVNVHEQAAIMAVVEGRQGTRFIRSGIPRVGAKATRQKPPRKNCRHRKPARARRRKARLTGGRR